MSTCGGCASRWTGLRMAHCGACHETFSTPANFDRHRRRFRCVDPADVGLVPGPCGWQQPAREAE